MARSTHNPAHSPDAFPSSPLRERLRSVGIGRMYHAHASLAAMVEKGTGCRVDGTPDELAEALIRIEECREPRRARAAIARNPG